MRTLKEIDHEYVQMCAQVGHMQQQISQARERLIKVRARISELCSEAIEVQSSKEEEKPSEGIEPA